LLRNGSYKHQNSKPTNKLIHAIINRFKKATLRLNLTYNEKCSTQKSKLTYRLRTIVTTIETVFWVVHKIPHVRITRQVEIFEQNNIIGTLWKLESYGTVNNVHVWFLRKTRHIVFQNHLLVLYLRHFRYWVGFWSLNIFLLTKLLNLNSIYITYNQRKIDKKKM